MEKKTEKLDQFEKIEKIIRFKLTNQDLTTHNGFKWEIGKKEVTSGNGELCSDGWLHCYTNPYLAILLNPIHANILNPRLFEVECCGKNKTDKGLKEGFTEMRLVSEIPIPEISLNQKISFSIYCSLEVYKDEKYVIWANNWLNNVDRTADAAARAADAASYAADAASYAADAASYAARAASYAADAARAEIDFISIIEKIKLIK